ncbi:MAG: hypothetical protein OEW11_00215 [Nitrospirota bacterium]|nr:hypothetical protein [Nitrospirota bacterium]
MKLACPSCKQELDVLAVDERLCADVTCGHCAAVIGVSVSATIIRPGAAASAAPSTPKVTVVMRDDQMRTAYVEALRAAGFAVTDSGDARQALERLGQDVPNVAVIDGGFEPVFGMGIGEILKKSNVTRNTRVLGLHSDPSASLPVPGADHTMPAVAGAEAVVAAVHALASGERPAAVAAAPVPEPVMQQPPAAPVPEPVMQQPPAAPVPEPVMQRPPAAPVPEPVMQRPPAAPVPEPVMQQPPAAPSPASAGTTGGAPGAPGSGSGATATISKPLSADPDHAKAQRLARTIVSDIALYNQEAVQDGIKNGNLRQTLEQFLDEGREHYKEKVSPEIQSSTDYFNDAVEAFVARKTASAPV